VELQEYRQRDTRPVQLPIPPLAILEER